MDWLPEPCFLVVQDIFNFTADSLVCTFHPKLNILILMDLNKQQDIQSENKLGDEKLEKMKKLLFVC